MIEATLENGIGRITLNSPEVHNSLTCEAMNAVQTKLDEWANSNIRVLVLTGTGKSFCSGVSLGDLGTGDWSNNPLTALCDAVEDFHTPTICALNGGVYGGGAELAISCDFRVGVAGMKMFVPAIKIGVHYDAAGIARYIQKLGSQSARRIFLLAEKFDDVALIDIGFLDYLVAPEEFDQRVDELTDTINSAAPLAVQGMKRSILEISRGTLDTDEASQRTAKCFASEDHREGLEALSQKRNPLFKGS